LDRYSSAESEAGGSRYRRRFSCLASVLSEILAGPLKGKCFSYRQEIAVSAAAQPESVLDLFSINNTWR
jgi:hypothetical protein